MTHASCQSIVSGMDAIGVHPAIPCPKQTFHAVMHSIEKPLSVKRAALEYDSYTKHLRLLVFSEQ